MDYTLKQARQAGRHHTSCLWRRRCLGAPLARAEAQIAIAALLERFPVLPLDPQHAVEHKRAPVFNGLEALWVCTD